MRVGRGALHNVGGIHQDTPFPHEYKKERFGSKKAIICQLHILLRFVKGGI